MNLKLKLFASATVAAIGITLFFIGKHFINEGRILPALLCFFAWTFVVLFTCIAVIAIQVSIENVDSLPLAAIGEVVDDDDDDDEDADDDIFG